HPSSRVAVTNVLYAPSTRGLVHRPCTAVTGVRIPVGTPTNKPTIEGRLFCRPLLMGCEELRRVRDNSLNGLPGSIGLPAGARPTGIVCVSLRAIRKSFAACDSGPPLHWRASASNRQSPDCLLRFAMRDAMRLPVVLAQNSLSISDMGNIPGTPASSPLESAHDRLCFLRLQPQGRLLLPTQNSHYAARAFRRGRNP